MIFFTKKEINENFNQKPSKLNNFSYCLFFIIFHDVIL